MAIRPILPILNQLDAKIPDFTKLNRFIYECGKGWIINNQHVNPLVKYRLIQRKNLLLETSQSGMFYYVHTGTGRINIDYAEDIYVDDEDLKIIFTLPEFEISIPLELK